MEDKQLAESMESQEDEDEDIEDREDDIIEIEPENEDEHRFLNEKAAVDKNRRLAIEKLRDIRPDVMRFIALSKNKDFSNPEFDILKSKIVEEFSNFRFSTKKIDSLYQLIERLSSEINDISKKLLNLFTNEAGITKSRFVLEFYQKGTDINWLNDLLSDDHISERSKKVLTDKRKTFEYFQLKLIDVENTIGLPIADFRRLKML